MNRSAPQAPGASSGTTSTPACTHIGYGVDDPLDHDTNGPLRNETLFANLLWDMNKSVRVGFEFTWRETAYSAPLLSNAGAVDVLKLET